MFEGEYLNCERFNGKGKEYFSYPDKLLFEGEYYNGKPWNGKINNYDLNGNLALKFELINGIINGKGEEYISGVLIFEGEYLYGQRWKGKEYFYFDDNIILIIEGEYINGIIKGNNLITEN